ncbi:hypothetical protein ABZX12_04330 [Kribbella sp. NPDC003505]|uniref:hypothetical protein n=1 Tax=Kribbella sp. NPDC003505 TaxID=3154448 RepID=UPI0033B518AC
MQIIEHSIIGTRSAALRVRRRDTAMEFLLIPMLHIADPEFFGEVKRLVSDADLVVQEGVRGSSAIVTALTMTYRIIPANRRSGLVADTVDYEKLDVQVVNADATAEEVGKCWRSMPWRLRLLLWLLIPYVMLLQLVGGRRRLLCPSVEVSDLPTRAEELAGDEVTLQNVLVDQRDTGLFSLLGDLVRDRSDEQITVAVVYGARHMPGIVDYLRNAHGYIVRDADWIIALAA